MLVTSLLFLYNLSCSQKALGINTKLDTIEMTDAVIARGTSPLVSIVKTEDAEGEDGTTEKTKRAMDRGKSRLKVLDIIMAKAGEKR
tara:strand:- start:147 stop:407 length:261 start_codon:yes stop_codon:yes gene_type:complete